MQCESVSEFHGRRCAREAGHYDSHAAADQNLGVWEDATTKPTPVGKVVVTYTEYWSGNHRPYRNVLHNSETDADLGQVQPHVIQEAIAAAEVRDGDEIEITVRKTGRRPFGDRRMVRGAPHTYEREP